MFFSTWMKHIKDDVRLTQLVIPGAHNAGSYGMNKMACCQNHNILTQFNYGIRHFCLRLDTNKKGELVLSHGITKGDLFENVLKDIKTALDNNPTEILLLDIREYYPQKFGPVTLKYKADPKKVEELLNKYIEPQKYAYYEFQHIKDVTVGDVRKANKRYILLNDNEEYTHSKNCRQILPWEKSVNGSHAKDFAKEALRFFDNYKTDGLYWFQTQQTPNLGTDIGLTPPWKLDKELRLHFKEIIQGIADNPLYLSSANIIAGDFMTEDFLKAKAILKLNLLKGNVKPEEYKTFQNNIE